jgi:hypothetical protein
MPPFQFAVMIFVLLGLAVLGVAAVLSRPGPYGIILESWRQTIELLRYRRRLALYAIGFFIIQQASPPLVALYMSPKLWVGAGILFCVQALVIYALAHVAYRLHRGLIYNEWKEGLTWGDRERRMALYVLASWLVLAILGHMPIPVTPRVSPIFVSIIGKTIWILTFVLKVLLALMGPAASLDDPKPLRRSISSVFRQPVAVFSVVIMIRLIVELMNQAFAMATGESMELLILRGASTLIATTFVFILAEFALVILVTRIWENRYEPETRHAAHNLNWF